MLSMVGFLLNGPSLGLWLVSDPELKLRDERAGRRIFEEDLALVVVSGFIKSLILVARELLEMDLKLCEDDGFA